MESNFYTTPWRIVVRERFLHLARALYRGDAKGKALDGHAPLPQNGRYLSRIERVESAERGDRGRMTL
jgi:hypothetical protein